MSLGVNRSFRIGMYHSVKGCHLTAGPSKLSREATCKLVTVYIQNGVGGFLLKSCDDIKV